MIKEIIIGLIPTIITIGTPVLIRVLNKRIALIKNDLLKDLAIETLLEVDLFFKGKDKIDKFTHTAEITKNRSNWETNIHHTDAICIKAWNKCVTLKWSNSNPLYPYYRQLARKNKNNNNGTSPTWINYQKMIEF